MPFFLRRSPSISPYTGGAPYTSPRRVGIVCPQQSMVTSRISIDGVPSESIEEISSGVHDFDLQIANVPERAHLQLYWARTDNEWVLIPPEAWTPAESARARVRGRAGASGRKTASP